MGSDLFDRFPDLEQEADDVLGYSIRELCLQDPGRHLDLTHYTQPALYVVNAMAYLARIEEDDRLPDFVAGHSLGEYNALLAAGAFDFLTGLRLVKKRGELMGRATGGGMAAVIGLTAEQVAAILEEQGLHTLDLANFNAPRQTVISGPTQDILAAKPHFLAGGAQTFWPLKVSAAFHSRYMLEAQTEFRTFLEQFSFTRPNLSVVANVTARPYEPDKTSHLLAEQLGKPVRWLQSMRYLLEQPEPRFFELGPGTVLSSLLSKIEQQR